MAERLPEGSEGEGDIAEGEHIVESKDVPVIAAATQPPSRRRKLLLVAVSLLVSLLFAEVALRLTGIVGTHRGAAWFAGGNHPRFLFQPDAESGYTLRPGFHGHEVARGREFDTTVAIDARGLRDHRHGAPPRPLVLALGDSMTFGEGVGSDAAWPAVLERTLGVRVVNAGVPGYGSPQMRGRLRRLLPSLRPDLVVVALSPHWDQQRCAEPFVYKDGYIVGAGYADKLYLIHGNLYVADVRWPVVGTATAWAKRFSHVARLLLPAVRATAGAIAHAGRPGVDPDAAGDVSATAATLVGLRGDAADAGVPLLVVFLDSRGAGYEADRDALAAALRRRNVDYVALDALVPREQWPALRYARDRHWNAAGHRRVGELLAPRVRAALAKRVPAWSAAG
jgi:lysophospholipase L1-like esterase